MYQKIKAKFKASPTVFYACSIVASWAGVGSLMNFRTIALRYGAVPAIIWAVFNSLACITFGLFADRVPSIRRIMQSKVMFYFIGLLTLFQTWTQMSGIYEIFGDTPIGTKGGMIIVYVTCVAFLIMLLKDGMIRNVLSDGFSWVVVYGLLAVVVAAALVYTGGTFAVIDPGVNAAGIKAGWSIWTAWRNISTRAIQSRRNRMKLWAVSAGWRGKRMAVKRMFSSSVTETDSFLELPLKSQALYFHLGMQGDDDGFVANPRAIIRSIGCTARDLKPLETAGYVISFPSKVLVITDWKANNNLRNDRYKPTAFQNELAQLAESANKRYILANFGIPTGNQTDTIGIPSDNQVTTQHSIAEHSSGRSCKKAATAARQRPTAGYHTRVCCTVCRCLYAAVRLYPRSARRV